MRQIINMNSGWSFFKDTKEIPATLPADWEVVNVPHTWNNIDGMDGAQITSVVHVTMQKLLKKLIYQKQIAII